MVSSIFEARQVINHSIVLVNDKIIDKRSYTLRSNDILSLDLKLLSKFVNNCINRINIENILLRTPIYLEVNYKLYMVIFLFNLIKINNISYNFNLKSAELNSILYYYY
jgi:ribosomal protein S4